jgi:hypothetical protein
MDRYLFLLLLNTMLYCKRRKENLGISQTFGTFQYTKFKYQVVQYVLLQLRQDIMHSSSLKGKGLEDVIH